ncbi:hypothetical protein [Aquimarina sp. AU474]|uniref:hypothetical protein n=1 Tax=Aquimarina sp. AU474 TaxID=2108529 RepID=UPI000D69ECBF|nr:hypothetical protein [Aquimarina sp. AU474]
MKNFFTQYLPLILLGVLVFISLTTLFKIPKNLENAINSINSANKNINSSLEILKAQKVRLDSLEKINQGLLVELSKIKESNSEISTSIEKRLKTAQWYLTKIRKDIEKLPKDFSPIN